MYLSQFRSFAGFAISEQLGVGLTYTNPLEDADSVMVALPGGGAGPVILRNAELVEAYLSLRWRPHQMTATLGQRQDPNDFVGSLYAVRQLNSQVGLYTNTSYADSCSWAVTGGLQWAFGPGASQSLLSSTQGCSPTLVRAQNQGGLPNPYSDPSLRHNLNLDPQRFGSLITNSTGGGIIALSTTPTSEGGGEDIPVIETTGGVDPSDPPLGFDQAIIPENISPAEVVPQ